MGYIFKKLCGVSSPIQLSPCNLLPAVAWRAVLGQESPSPHHSLNPSLLEAQA